LLVLYTLKFTDRYEPGQCSHHRNEGKQDGKSGWEIELAHGCTSSYLESGHVTRIAELDMHDINHNPN
jgi:hypothetical protein